MSTYESIAKKFHNYYEILSFNISVSTEEIYPLTQRISLILKEISVILKMIDEQLLLVDQLDKEMSIITKEKKSRIHLSEGEKEIVDRLFYTYEKLSVLIKAIYEWVSHLTELINKSDNSFVKQIFDPYYSDLLTAREQRNKLVAHFAGGKVLLASTIGFHNNHPYVYFYPSALEKPDIGDYLAVELKAIKQLHNLFNSVTGKNAKNTPNREMIKELCELHIGDLNVQRWIREYGGYLSLDNSNFDPIFQFLDSLITQLKANKEFNTSYVAKNG
jgi:hypothetical protein